MKVLFFTNRIHNINVLLDEAISLQKSGNEVYFIYNNCTTKICECNMNKNSYLCEVCHRKMTKSINILPKGIKRIDIKDYWDESSVFSFEYKTAQELKSIEYKGVKVGYAVLSAFLSHSRNCNPKVDEDAKKYFDLLISTSCRITDALEKAIQIIQPDKICLGNARFFDSRPAFDLAKGRGIDVVSIDRKMNYEGKWHLDRFINHTPHDVQYRLELRDDLWDNAPMLDDEKQKIGESFFLKRRNGILAADKKVYTTNQQYGQLPIDWNPSKKNIVIFNSSEDEFASIGKDFDKLALFTTQYKGIRYILDTLMDKQDIHVYLRVHPNLSEVPYRYHTELMKLSELYDNITVIPGKDAVSTYALMEGAEKVIVFGSTMGLESAYWGKAVINLAGAFYYYSDICYVPQTKDELKALLTQSLPPKKNDEAIKWGFYYLYCNPKALPQNLDLNTDWFRMGRYRNIENVHYLKLLGSSKLYAIYLYLVTRKYRKNITMLNMPQEEDYNAEL